MADSRIVNEWLKKAYEDLDFAISVVDDSDFYAQICFHFQQAAEKGLKAFIIAHDLEFKKIHDLTVLLKLCMKKRVELKVLEDDCRFLNGFYIVSIHKWLFFIPPGAGSICGITCAAYSSTPPRNPLISLIL